ncbi:unnamed protein product, partial [Effrenium voratum]
MSMFLGESFLLEGELCLGRHLLHVDASHGSESVIGQGALALFTEFAKLRPEVEVRHLRLWEDEELRARMEYSLRHVRAKMARMSQRGSEEDVQCFANIELLAAEIATARGLVISAPMWNYGVPWVLKQYFDAVLHPGLSFQEAEGGCRGLLGGGRPLVLLTSAGGGAQKGHLTPWVLDVGAMLGFDEPKVVAVAHLAR